jgi:type II secretory pathway component PulF
MTKNRMVITGEIKSGLYYPAFIGCLLLVAMIVVNFYVLPMITKNFKLFHTALPPATQAMFDLLTFISNHPQIAFIPPVLIVVAFLRRRWIFKQDFSQKVVVRLPVLGILFQKEILSRSLRTLSMLYQTGVYQRDAFAITANVADHVEYSAYFRAISEHLSKSANLYQAFLRERHRIGRLGRSVADQMKVASSSADPSIILTRIASLFEEEALRDAKNMPKLIEPILILIILGFVSFLAAAIYLPNLYLMSHVAQHPGLMGGGPPMH